MNSMHNSFSGPGGYSGAYPGYVPPPPSALPYYNGYPGDINQGSNPYYGKPGTSSVPPGYSSGMAAYNSSMYYQQYGLGYQYGYNKYSLSSSLGYSSDIPAGPSIHPPTIGTLQAPTTDLGLTGSMFSKNNKFSSSQSSSTPHLNLNHGTNATMLSPAGTPNTPSPGPHVLSGSLRGPGATPSPPVDVSESKKDLDKMRRCQVCGQVFRLMSECLAHMKAVHEAPLSVYSLQHTAGGHVTQTLSSASGLPPHSLTGGLVPPTSRHASMGTPDSPLMALERMGWGEKQNIMSLQSSSSPLTSPYTAVSTLSTTSQHLPTGPHTHHQTTTINQSQATPQVYQAHQHSIPGQHQSPHLQSPVQHHSPSSIHQSPVRHPSPVRHASPAPQFINVSQHPSVASNHSSPAVSDASISDSSFSQPSAIPSTLMASTISTGSPKSSINIHEDAHCHSIKQRKTNSYSVSSIIGETKDMNQDIKPNVESLEIDIKEEKLENLDSIENKIPEPIKLQEVDEYSSNKDVVQSEELDESKNSILAQPDISEMEIKSEPEEPCNLTVGGDSIPVKSEEAETRENSAVLEATQQSPPEIKNDSLDLTKNTLEVTDHDEEKSAIDEPQIGDISSGDGVYSQDKSPKTEPYADLPSPITVKEEQVSNDSLRTGPEKDSELEDRKDDIQNDESAEDQQSTDCPEQCVKDEQIPENSQLSQEEALQPSPLPQQASMSQQQQASQIISTPQSMQQQHSSPPVGMYHNPASIKQQPPYSNWPLAMGSGYAGQYPYPCPQGPISQSNPQIPPNTISGGNMCPKPHGYPPMHTRYPSQYQQPGTMPGGPYPHDHHARGPGPHNFMQNHPQGNWFPSNQRPDSKGMWTNWPNQSGQQPYPPQGFYGYPGPNQPQGQKVHHHHHQQQPPPAHVHPPQVPHMHNMQHSHMPQQPPPPQISKASQISQSQQHFQQQTQIQQVGLAQQQQQQLVHQQTINQQRQVIGISVSPHELPKEHSPSNASILSPGRQQERSCQTPQAIPDQQISDLTQPSVNLDKVTKQTAIDTSITSDKSTETIPQLHCPTSTSSMSNTVVRKGHRAGPKSKTLAAKQYSQLDDLDNYKCTITVQEQNSVNGYTSQSSSAGDRQSCDSSDSEMTTDDSPTFTLLKPAKRKHINGGVFVGPKRIKLAKQVRERQQRRKRHLQEQLRQNELEEQLLAQRAEIAAEQHEALASVLLQSSILLADNKVEESNSVEECIASIKAGKTNGTSVDSDSDRANFSTLSNGSNVAGIKKPGRRSQTKVFHNENSVIIKDMASPPPLRKLRAKDFKWSHYIKSMRYWCNDCGQGFKNQREANNHTEEKCKWNCLYTLECYVMVTDIQSHHEYGSKVQELLEEYQVDGAHHCITCSETIARKADFLVHVDTHKDFMPWECTICGTRFKIRGSLKEHLRYTHMKGRVPCLKCNKVFPTSTLLRQHVKVHTQHYKYKSAKNREEELRAAMEATAGALDVPVGTTSIEDNEKLSHEANEYRSWCKLMEMNALKNLSTPGTLGSAGGDDDYDGMNDLDGNASGEEPGYMMGSGMGENPYSEMPRRSCESKIEMSS